MSIGSAIIYAAIGLAAGYLTGVASPVRDISRSSSAGVGLFGSLLAVLLFSDSGFAEESLYLIGLAGALALLFLVHLANGVKTPESHLPKK